jgi:hypothetical protein
LTIFFYGVFVRFSARGVQKHDKNFLKEVHGPMTPAMGQIEIEVV